MQVISRVIIHVLLMLLLASAFTTTAAAAEVSWSFGGATASSSRLLSPTGRVKKAGGDYNNAVYEEEVVDLKVNVLGGVVKHTRYLSGGVTQFNPNWANLVLEFPEDKATLLPETLKRNRHKYVRQGETDTWVYDERNYITKTENGYRWHNRHGDWLDYNNDGVSLGYGDRNNVQVTFTRDAKGRIERVLDHFKTPVLTFHYYADTGWLEKVVDYTGRQVGYEYTPLTLVSPMTSTRGVVFGGRLTKITDVTGQAWIYNYSVGPYFLLTKKTGPEGQVIDIGYGGLPGEGGGGGVTVDATVCVDWVAESWVKGEAGNWQVKMKCLATASSGGSVTVTESDSEAPQLNPEDRVDPVIHTIKINGEQLRRYIYLYNKAKKQWVRGVQDGDGGLIVTRINEQGELLELIRNGRSAEKMVIAGNSYTVIDENGNKTVIQKDSFKNVVQKTYADGSTRSTTWNTQYSLPTSVTDENGSVTQYEYDATGNLLKLTEAAGTAEAIVTQYEYDQYGQGTKILYADGRVEHWTYDDKGNETTYTDGEGYVTRYEDYDAEGNPRKITDGRGNVTQSAYNNAGNTTKLTTPLGSIATYEYDGRGNLVKLIDALQQEMVLTYDARDRLTEIRNPLGETLKVGYNSRGYITSIVDPTNKTVLKAEYDLDGHLLKTIDGNGNAITGDYGYLNLKPYKGLLNEAHYPSYNTSFEYDSLNRITRETDQAAGEIPRTRSYRYDLAGNLTQFTDPNGHVSKLFYDVHQRVVRHEDRMQQSTQYGYDIHHNLNKVTNARNEQIRRYEYNNRDELTKEVLPDNSEYRLAYDANGNVIKQVDAKGQVSTYEYDADDRLVSSRYFDNEADSADIANARKTVTYGYDVLNRLTRYDDGVTSGSYTYDAADRLTSWTTNYGSFSKTAAYSYYPNGLKKSFTGPDGITVTYSYDNNNQLQTVSIPGQGSFVVNENQWLAAKTVTLPGGIQQGREYDGYLRPRQINVSKGAGTKLFDYQYEYDPADNITAQNIQTGSKPGQRHFEYDSKERLTQYTLPGDNGSTETVNLGYDAVGNRSSDSRDDYQNPGWDYDAQDRLTRRGDLNYGYDANGSLISISHATLNLQKTFVYDHVNRLREVKAADGSPIASYQYDPFGRRISKTVNGNTTYFFYASEGLVAEFDASGNVTTRYGYKPGSTWGTSPLYIQQNGYTGYYLNDHLGTPQQVVTASGTVLWDASYTPFGQASVNTKTITNNLRLAGQYYDAETGLHYNYFRYYDPEIGRYITSDPIGLAGGINTYAYVGGNPLYWIDPLGLSQGSGSLSGMVADEIYDFLIADIVNTITQLWYGCYEDALTSAVLAGFKPFKLLKKLEKKFCSFEGSTLVATPEGYREISSLKEGDLVYARDEKTGEVTAKPVSHVFVEAHDSDVRLLTVASVSGETVITTSDEHPFFVEGKGWIRADELQTGDQLVSLKGDRLTLKGSERIDSAIEMYNLEVADFHTYAVSDQELWVHNTCKLGRSGALNSAKSDLGIPRMQHPDGVKRVPMTDSNRKAIIGSNGKPIMTREYTYTRPDGSKVVIQDHSAGHQFGQGGVGDQGPHFNVRPPENTRTGSVPGTQDHYSW
ncbi:MAG: polymorphic toxin-type HINT domain-containing protein [Candidatus Thiothrix putei]|uniref:Polymorphic toxin-type HINT domain-containing protein n=1 Tax=Candidatus Thiothrix putei TaxID=3080811 RepID=A0AA95KSA1_9GAMM|nr:MAG: polymorphic toxin-type HINT domain-containing protein [Candidatus Thiothrix putei]